MHAVLMRILQGFGLGLGIAGAFTLVIFVTRFAGDELQ